MTADSLILDSGDCLILSGASFGVGRALAPALANEGFNLILNARSIEPLQEAAEECKSLGVQALAVPGDISLDATAVQLVQAAQDMGSYKGFIQVAGLLRPGPTVWELSPEDAAAVMDASYGGALALIRQAVPPLIDQKQGLAVFFGSGAADRQQPGIGVYSVAKAAQEALVKELAAETQDITAFVYRPGIVETRMQAQARNSKGGAAHILRPIFQGWKQDGALMSPEESAGRLVKVMKGDLSGLHGKTVDARDVGNDGR